MTTRYNSLTVILDHDIREDDAESLLNAIRMLRGVIDVSGNASSTDDHVAQIRVRAELGKQLFNVLYPNSKYQE